APRLGPERGRARARRGLRLCAGARPLRARRGGSLHLRPDRAPVPTAGAPSRSHGRRRGEQAHRGAATSPRDAATAATAAERLSEDDPSRLLRASIPPQTPTGLSRTCQSGGDHGNGTVTIGPGRIVRTTFAQ